MIANTWSGDVVAIHVVFSTQPLPPEHAKPPPGLRKSAPEFDCVNRSFHPHCPAGLKFWFACTDTKYVPAVSMHPLGSATLKLPVATPDVIGSDMYVHVADAPGKPAAFG